MSETVSLETAEKYRQRAETIKRMAEGLAYLAFKGGDCELTGFSGSGRCVEPAVAVRFEHHFLDEVCEEHAMRALERGAQVVYPKQANGVQ